MRAIFFATFLCFLALPIKVNSQYWYKQDTTCYSSQYVAVEIGELSPVPAWLKDSLAHETRDSTDFFDLVHELNREGLLNVYNWNRFIKPKQTPEEVNLLLENSRDIHSIDNPEFYFPFYFYRFIAHNNFMTSNDEGSQQENELMNEITPLKDTLDFFFVRLDEVRILEAFDLEDRSKKPEILMLGFVGIDPSENYQELFWIDYKELLDAIQIKGLNAKEFYWYKILNARNYKGFRYKQNPCDKFINR
jgi:hypothetical protein